jgi:hypothetical protein
VNRVVVARQPGGFACGTPALKVMPATTFLEETLSNLFIGAEDMV